MNIIVLGAGAIGSLYGAKLSKANNVTLIARKEHAGRINKHGLKITGIENKTYKINAVECERVSSLACHTKIKKIEVNTLILLTTKVYDSKNAVNGIKSLIKNDTAILCLQNGLYSENAVKEIIKNKCIVLRAVTNFGAAFLEPGVVKYNSRSYTAIQESPRSREIAENFTQCGLNGFVSRDIKYDMWKKLIFNCVLNPVTAILGIGNRDITDERLNPLKKMIAEECLKVAEKDGIRFGFDFVDAVNREFKGSMNISSMRQDLMKGKKTEIDYLNGAVVGLGKRYGIKCPVNGALTSLIKEMEKPQQNL